VTEPVRRNTVAAQERDQHGTGLRADRDGAVLSAVRGLVLLGPEHPYRTGAVDLVEAERRRFTWPHPGQEL
jgi:hypothetical protein